MKTTEQRVMYLSPVITTLESIPSQIICQSPKPGENESIKTEEWEW